MNAYDQLYSIYLIINVINNNGDVNDLSSPIMSDHSTGCVFSTRLVNLYSIVTVAAHSTLASVHFPLVLSRSYLNCKRYSNRNIVFIMVMLVIRLYKNSK